MLSLQNQISDEDGRQQPASLRAALDIQARGGEGMTHSMALSSILFKY